MRHDTSSRSIDVRVLVAASAGSMHCSVVQSPPIRLSGLAPHRRHGAHACVAGETSACMHMRDRPESPRRADLHTATQSTQRVCASRAPPPRRAVAMCGGEPGTSQAQARSRSGLMGQDLLLGLDRVSQTGC
jgi:hypothetical protein